MLFEIDHFFVILSCFFLNNFIYENLLIKNYKKATYKIRQYILPVFSLIF